jgi:hypothetical protein
MGKEKEKRKNFYFQEGKERDGQICVGAVSFWAKLKLIKLTLLLILALFVEVLTLWSRG